MDLIKKSTERAIAAHKKNVSSDIIGFSMKKPEMDPVQLDISEKKREDMCILRSSTICRLQLQKYWPVNRYEIKVPKDYNFFVLP